jgi:hypothetical protein
MATIVYIAESGDDKNDGKTPETAVYSRKRAYKLAGGNGEMRMPQATLDRLLHEIADNESSR